MTKEQQNLAWACLPKEVRDEMRHDYSKSQEDNYDKGWDSALSYYFGTHNLTSDIEPEEMLMVNKSKIIERINYLNSHPEEFHRGCLAYERAEELSLLFGDKCLPDKEEQAKPKFDKGQKVRFEYSKDSYSRVCEIKDIRIDNGVIEYQIGSVWAKEPFIIPYTEEKKMKTLAESLPEAQEIIDDNFWDLVNADNNMEEKELNLCELLKGCEGETFYSLVIGECVLTEIHHPDSSDTYPIRLNHSHYTSDGRFQPSGEQVVFPSRASYEKYPLDPYSAWMEWKEARKPKRWRAKSSAGLAVSECENHWEDYTYWYLTDDCIIVQEEETGCKKDTNRYNLGNYFRTEEEAEQAAEELCKTLEAFHQRKEAAK